ncbi:MAG: single-stranded-DNA-specific exonuclease RecJ [Bacillales bacterium]
MKNFEEKLKEFYKLDDETFNYLIKDLNIDDLPNYLNYKDIEKIVNFVKNKVNNKEKILIYGDYDCDGIMSTSIIYLTLKTNDYTPGYYIPFREIDGYGLTIKNIDKFNELGYKTIILVDNGITLIEEVNYAKKLGIDIIILDHHKPESITPNTEYILHPELSNFSQINMSAGTICYFFSRCYLGYVDEYLLVLAMISTLSDLMELIEYNRIIVKVGLKILNKNKYKNILMLLNDKEENINEDDISMILVPKINSVGRLISNNNIFNIVKFFINKDNIDIYTKLNIWINSVNTYRKELIKNIYNCKYEYNDKLHSILFKVDDVKEGLIGLIANKYMNDFNKPTIILSEVKNNENLLKGSIRSKEGFNVNNFFYEIKDILYNFGGHSKAGGLTILKENYNNLEKAFDNYAIKHPFIDDNNEYINITIDDINYINYELIRKLSPFGQGFKKPKFLLSNINTSFLHIDENSKHIICNYNVNSSIIYFNYPKSILERNNVNLYGYMNENIFKNHRKIQFNIKEYK